MNKRFLGLCVIGCALGLAAGIYGPRLMKELRPAETAELRLDIPEDGIKSDAFSLRLLQQAVKQAPASATVMVAPAPLTALLTLLEDISSGNSQEQIKALQADREGEDFPEFSALFAVDTDVTLIRSEDMLRKLPFREDYPTALSLFNTLLGCGQDGFGSRAITPETRFVAAYRLNIAPKWRLPMQETRRPVAFDNADGRMPECRMLSATGNIRMAEAPDGSWKAAALFLKTEASVPKALVCIVPTAQARAFAEQLSEEQLSAIRTALAQATPQPGTVLIPALHLRTGARNNAALLRDMGMTDVFDVRKADFSPAMKGSICLNGLWEQTELQLRADTEGTVSPQEPLMTVDKPFLWFIGDLTTPHPPYLMGIIENL